MTYYSQPVSLWDTSTHCAECGVQYIYCGCPNEDSGFTAGLPCGDCGFVGHALAYFAGDNTGRCAYCHNNARVVGVSTSEGDWF